MTTRRHFRDRGLLRKSFPLQVSEEAMPKQLCFPQNLSESLLHIGPIANKFSAHSTNYTSQWETGWRIIDRIKVHFCVLWQYPRLVMPLYNANVITCVTWQGVGGVSVMFSTPTPFWPCRRVPWANCTAVQIFPAL